MWKYGGRYLQRRTWDPYAEFQINENEQMVAVSKFWGTLRISSYHNSKMVKGLEKQQNQLVISWTQCLGNVEYIHPELINDCE